MHLWTNFEFWAKVLSIATENNFINLPKIKSKDHKTTAVGSTLIMSLTTANKFSSFWSCLGIYFCKSFRFHSWRSSRPDVFCKKDVLRNFAKFTGKYLRQSLFFNKVQQACNFIKKETLAQVFSCKFCKISNNTSYRTPLVAASVLYSFMLVFLFFGRRYDKSVRIEERETPYTPIITTCNHVGNHNWSLLQMRCEPVQQ